MVDDDEKLWRGNLRFSKKYLAVIFIVKFMARPLKRFVIIISSSFNIIFVENRLVLMIFDRARLKMWRWTFFNCQKDIFFSRYEFLRTWKGNKEKNIRSNESSTSQLNSTAQLSKKWSYVCEKFRWKLITLTWSKKNMKLNS